MKAEHDAVRLSRPQPPSGAAARRLVILDRDGVLNRDDGHVGFAAGFVWNEDAIAAVRWLNEQGFAVVVATNQAGIAKGVYTESDFRHLMIWVERELESHGARLDGVYYCPHHPADGSAPYRMACACRKPQPGLLIEAMDDFRVAPEDCVMIGDKESDRLAAEAAGVRSVTYTGGSLLRAVRSVFEGRAAGSPPGS